MKRRTLRDLSPERLEQRLAPAVYRVTTALDDTNATPASGTGTAGDPFLMGTLRGAILATNATVGVADEITFAAGLNGTPITLTIAGEDNTASAGDLDITDDLTITGNGSANTIIQAGTTTLNGIDKVFGINPTGASDIDVTMTGITVRFGRNTSLVATGQDAGGGIDFLAGGAGASSSSLTISDSVITQNSTVLGTDTTGHTGGGLSIRESSGATGIATINNTTISNNSSAGNGGGIGITGANLVVAINDSAITGNTTLTAVAASKNGGGISIVTSSDLAPPTAFLTIDDSVISGNTAAGLGGGVAISGLGAHAHVITDTTITGNFSNGDGALIGAAGGGLYTELTTVGATATLTNVLVAANHAEVGTTADGGGIFHLVGALVLNNSTISGNLATRDGGGLLNNAVATLNNVTVANNRADNDNNAVGAGGGIRALAASTTNLNNTIVDGNFRGTGVVVDDVNGAVTANFSLIGNTTGAVIVGANNQLDVSAVLSALADNGAAIVGPTGSTVRLQTHALESAASAAIETGSNALAVGLTTDQRGAGFLRLRDSGDADVIDTVDIGAFEAQVAVENVANQSMNEDTTLNLVFNVGDVDTPITSVTATSSNTTLVPNLAANISISGSGSTRTLTVTPVANLFGTTTITLTVNGTVNGSPQTMTDTFVLTVDPVGDPPTVAAAFTTQGVLSDTIAITPNPVDGASITHFRLSNYVNGTLFLADGVTPIASGTFITAAQAAAGVRFQPTAGLVSAGANFSFDVQSATSGAGAGLSTPTTAPVHVSDIAGAWFFGPSTEVLRDGTNLTFVNERGEVAAGTFVDGDTVIATGWGGLVGELGVNSITWANATVWTRTDEFPFPALAEDFRIFGLHAHAEQKFSELWFTNERGEVSRGRVISNTSVSAVDWGELVGTLVNGNTQINWANGTTWAAPPVEAAADVSGTYTINGIIAHIKQNGRALTLVNERGEISTASLSLDNTTITADNWPVIGTVGGGGNITWSNGTAWAKTAFAIPQLSHTWSIGGRPTRLDYNNGELLLTNEFGHTTRAVFLSSTQILAVNWGITATLSGGNTVLTWGNGTVWTASPSTLDAFFAAEPDPFS